MAKVLKFSGRKKNAAASPAAKATRDRHRENIDAIDRDDLQLEAAALFGRIYRRFGIDEARRVFTKLGAPPSRRRAGELENWGLLDMYDMLGNVNKLARYIADENRKRPAAERYGPRGSTDPFTIERHLRQIIKSRKEALEAGTWRGPIPEWWWEKHPHG